mmetsp:Transcript_34705/g.73159  ORF Transcript_34705/g.73159 Transcript_34705/m.73159 type:complete len:227 (-) Transcript_34705:59-739(-)
MQRIDGRGEIHETNFFRVGRCETAVVEDGLPHHIIEIHRPRSLDARANCVVERGCHRFHILQVCAGVFLLRQEARRIFVLPMSKYMRLNPILIQHPPKKRILRNTPEQMQIPPTLQMNVRKRTRQKVLVPIVPIPERVTRLGIAIPHHGKQRFVLYVRIAMHPMRFVEDSNGISYFFHVGGTHGETHSLAEGGVEGGYGGVGCRRVEDGNQFLGFHRDGGLFVAIE